MFVAVSASIALYATHQYPGPGGRIWFGDSVSFQYYAISHSLGHSPGYPQYLALVRAIARVPIGQAWQRVNFVSALFGGLALGAHYALGRTLGLSMLQAIGGACVLGLSRTHYIESTEAEVYTLNLFWVLTCLALFVWYLNSREKRALYAFFAAYGCSLGHHPTMVLLVLPVIITLAIHDRRLLLDWRIYAAAACAIVLGCVQYIYTYRLFVDSTLSYRWIDYPQRTFGNFLDFTAGSNFRKLMFSQPIAALLHDKVPRLLANAHAQNVFILPVLGVVGLIASPRIAAASRTLLLLSIVAYSAWAIGYDVADIEAFCTPLWALCYLAVVAGLEVLLWRVALPRAAAVAVLVLSVWSFRNAVLATDAYRPDNYRLAIANEYIAAVPPGAALVPFTVEGNSALLQLFRYLETSGDSGPLRVAGPVKRCTDGVYFADESRKQVRARKYHERRVGHLERSHQDVFVMECGDKR